jgi:hypothetical protein
MPDNIPSPFELAALDAARMPEAEREPGLLLVVEERELGDEEAPDFEQQVAAADLKIDALEFREWHEKADKKADKKKGDDGTRPASTSPKKKLHLCFLEAAVIEVKLSGTGTALAAWQIVDSLRNVVFEHPVFNEANVAAGDARARMGAGTRWFKWDGRNKEGKLVDAGAYRSRLSLEGGINRESDPILAEGRPYRVFIVGEPKADAHLKQVLADEKKLLDGDGERTTRDTWIFAYRGRDDDDGHIVFFGQGTMEATQVTAGDQQGAVATPHGRDFKGWVRTDPHRREGDPDAIQVQDLGRMDGRVMLTNPGGPCPVNPFPGVFHAGTFKDGVQAHRSFSAFTSDKTSLGCTTIAKVPAGTCKEPSSVRDEVRSFQAAYGDFGKTERLRSKGGKPGANGPKFLNKQNKRNSPDDVRVPDDHATPVLAPASLDAKCLAGGFPDEPLHMQATLQAAVFGGFLNAEIPIEMLALADEPAGQARIRMNLRPYAADSAYHAYHHAVAFGHAVNGKSGIHTFTIWVPRKVIRGWNGNRRNLLVSDPDLLKKKSPHCHVSWTIAPKGGAPIANLLEPKRKDDLDGLAALSKPGLLKATWKSVSGVFEVRFAYRLAVKPAVEDADVWIPEPAAADPFSSLAKNPARLEAEVIERDPRTRELFLSGANVLELTI